jgi:crotonobetaine/carnitine-CoA ligase
MTPQHETAAEAVDDLVEGIPLEDRVPVRLFERCVAGDDAVAAIDADSGRSYTYAQLATATRRVARALAERGIGVGDRVAWSAPTGVDAIAIWIGIAQAGAVDVAIGDVLKGRMLEHVLTDCAPAAVITHERLVQGISGLSAERCAGYRAWLHVGADSESEPREGSLPLDLWAGDEDGDNAFSVAVQGPEEPATIIYTSGTTGPSKGVVLCHHHQFFAGANLAEQFRVARGSRLYHYSPFNHVTGRQLVVASMLVGGTLVMRERFRLHGFWDDINTHGVTHSITLGSAVPLLLDQQGPEIVNKGSLEYVWASPAMPKIYGEFAERFGVCVCSPYGSTEVGIVVSPALIPEDPGPSGNCGRRSRYYDLEILDDDDQIVAPGIVGEIAVRPKRPWTTFLGYLNRDAATVETTRNLWYHSGDLGTMDEQGYLFFVDRKQDFMRVKGENISSSELEQILVLHPAVADCAVVPVNSELGESDVLAVVVESSNGEGTFDPEAFYVWAAEEVPHYMVPRYIRVLDDMPRGHSGKIEKHKLRSQGVAEGTWDAATHGLRATRRGVVRQSS